LQENKVRSSCRETNQWVGGLEWHMGFLIDGHGGTAKQPQVIFARSSVTPQATRTDGAKSRGRSGPVEAQFEMKQPFRIWETRQMM
jgi:hypothetical protein